MITRESDYAIRAMLYLACRQGSGVVSTTVLAETMAIPYRFLRRILLRLGAKGLVASTRGKLGGLQLAQPAAVVSLLDIISAIDPETVMLNSCLRDSANCPRSIDCVVHQELSDVQEELLQRLSGIKLADLAARSDPNAP